MFPSRADGSERSAVSGFRRAIVRLAGYGPDEWRNAIFTPLRLEPWRVQVMCGQEYPSGDLTGSVWHNE
jgi:hypothetical protein